MSRALTSILLGAAILSGCVAQPPVDTSAEKTTSVISRSPIDDWLDQLNAVENMSPSEVMQQLEAVDKTANDDQLFYYGALNQTLQSYGAWTVARDTFQLLQEKQTLPKEQRQLANLLRQYNQSRINGHSRYNTLLDEQTELRERLSRAENEKRQLEEKIEALTELETAISTRQED
jgi:DNA repair exonuclease SbcCD ATPase subunit